MKEWFKTNLDKALWLVIGGAVGLSFGLVRSCYEHRVPDIKVIQNVRTVEKANYSGALDLDLGSREIATASGLAMTRPIYFLDISNTGRGTEDSLSVYVKFPQGVKYQYVDDMELQAYEPDGLVVSKDAFFVKLNRFPKKARTSLAFEILKGFDDICGTKVKVVGKESEWPVTTNWEKVCGS